MSSADNTTILGQWVLGWAAIGDGGSDVDYYWLPTAQDCANHAQQLTKIRDGLGREAGNFTADTRVKGATIDELIQDISGEVALIGGTAPGEIFGRQCRLATIRGVCAEVVASAPMAQTQVRDWYTDRYDKSIERLKEAIDKYQRGDGPGENDRARAVGASSIPVACEPGPASAGW